MRFYSHNITKAKTYKSKLRHICTAERVEEEKTASPVITKRKLFTFELKEELSYSSLYSYIALQLLCRNSIPVFPCIICKSRWWAYTFHLHSTNVAAKETVLQLKIKFRNCGRYSVLQELGIYSVFYQITAVKWNVKENFLLQLS